jgi:hypothetical protein
MGSEWEQRLQLGGAPVGARDFLLTVFAIWLFTQPVPDPWCGRVRVLGWAILLIAWIVSGPKPRRRRPWRVDDDEPISE